MPSDFLSRRYQRCLCVNREVTRARFLAMASVLKAEERAEKIRKVMVDFGLSFRQVCGQRIFGPPQNYVGKRPAKGCEVFVTNLPRDAREDQLITMFAAVGHLYEAKFMMEFSGMNRGFAYFLYVNHVSAMTAIKLYHGAVMNPGAHKLACYISLDNSKLYFEGMPTDLPVSQAADLVGNLFEDCERVTIFEDPKDAKGNLGVGFVEFATHRRAAEVRKLLWPSRIGVMNSNLFFEWAVPLPNFREYHVLIVTNISRKINNKTFTNFVLKEMQGRGFICNITKRGSFSTIQCFTRNQVLVCAERLCGKHFNGHPLTAFVVDKNGSTHDALILFLQWAVYERRSVVSGALPEFFNNPQSSISKLAAQMRHHLRDTNALLTDNSEKPEMPANCFEANGADSAKRSSY